jgi:hypothetical protein
VIGRQRYERREGGQRLSHRPDEDGGRSGGIFGAAGARDERAFRVGDPRKLAGRTQALEELAIELYARGLSTRDIEDAFKDQNSCSLLLRAAGCRRELC